jgi:hypothetical protein
MAEQSESIHEAAIQHGAARDAKDRRDDSITAQLLNMVDRLQRDVMEHMRKEQVTVQELKQGLARVEARVEQFIQAFPEGDAVRHRLAHEGQIKEAKKKEQFWEKMKFTLVALVMTAGITWLAFVAWKAFLLGPK